MFEVLLVTTVVPALGAVCVTTWVLRLVPAEAAPAHTPTQQHITTTHMMMGRMMKRTKAAMERPTARPIFTVRGGGIERENEVVNPTQRLIVF